MEAKNAEYYASKQDRAMTDDTLKGAPHHHVWGTKVYDALGYRVFETSGRSAFRTSSTARCHSARTAGS
eukprot:8271839-Heterocapsa_arctica.AAC.1